MKKYHNKYLLIVFLLILLQKNQLAYAAPSLEPEAPNAWQPVVDGIDYQVFHLNNPKPVNVFVTRLDRNNPNVTIESSIAQGRIVSGRESITGMAGRYEQAINYWGQVWGGRNKVVAAVNGYYFDGATGTPWSGVVHSGWYAKRFSDVVGDAGFAWTLNRNAFIGSCISHNNSKNTVTYVRADYSANIRGINIPAGSEDLIVYTPQYDSNTRTASIKPLPRVEFLVEMNRPTLILPPPSSYARGYIRQIRTSGFSTQIPFDHIVISAWGAVGDTILGRVDGGTIAVGDEIRVSQEISNCTGAPQVDWTKTYASIGGDYHYLNNGVIRTDFSNPDASVRNSRTAVAYNDSFVFFIVVDAFDPGVSEGLNVAQLGDFTKNTLGGLWAVTMDSGTSSTMVVNHQVVNNTYCNYTRNCGTMSADESPYLQDQVLPLEDTYGAEWTDESGVIEPLVGTGLMMVVVEPKQQSLNHHADEIVMTISSTELRLGPGTNYSTITSIPALTAGTVLDSLPGILAKGSYWWRVDFNGQVGWIKEEALLGNGSGPSNLKIFLPIVHK